MRYRSFWRFVAEGIEGLVLAFGVVVTWPLSRRWLADWGASPAERGAPRSGDALVAPGHRTLTRAITIAAPAERVWPWLVQFGLGRAGFYSYELLERLVGIPVKNVESVVPGFQSLLPGDEIRLHPKAPGIPVALVEPPRRLCLATAADSPSDGPDPARSWSMYLDDAGPGSVRLVLRSCIEPLDAPTLPKRVGGAIEESIDFIMEQRMLRTIRRLAESGETSSHPIAVG
jgi:hypothetical protein